jgi:hypothetical protein
MRPRVPLNVGGACAIVGAVGIFAGNFLHPFLPPDRVTMLEMVASHASWPALHLPTMFFAVAILLGLVALAGSLVDGEGAAWAGAGQVVAQVGVPVMLVGVAIDGFAFTSLADAWRAASPTEQTAILQAADALVFAEMGIMHTWVSFFLGLSVLLYGLAVVQSNRYWGPVGWLGVLGGMGCLFSGVAGFLRLPFQPPFPVFGMLVLAWMLAMGVLMMRRPMVREMEGR